MQIHTGPHNTPTFKKGIGWKIAILAILFVSLGFLSARYFLGDYQEWYNDLNKPFFYPPTWILAPIWTIIYILIAGSAGIVWQKVVVSRYPIKIRFAKRGLTIFFVHLLINLSWSPVFFHLRLPGLSVAIILILLALIIILIRHFFRIDRVATFLLIPYLVWIIYVAILNISIVILN